MALFIPGMACPLCSQAMRSRDDVVMFSPFVANRGDPLYLFSDGVFHRECFARHALAGAASERFEEMRRRTAPGNRKCVVCGEEIASPEDYFGGGHLTDDRKSPLWSFNYVHLHRSHFERWTEAAEFRGLMEELVNSEAWDGPHIIFGPAPVWRVRK